MDKCYLKRSPCYPADDFFRFRNVARDGRDKDQNCCKD